jgi:hypothetical protein
MDDQELSADETTFVRTLRRSYARLAGWMTRNNRYPEPGRLPGDARTETAARTEIPPRQPVPPRP